MTPLEPRPPRRVLLVSGSLRHGSTNTALLGTVQAVAPTSLDVVLYQHLGGLPHFNPDDAETLHPAVVELRAEIGRAEAVVFSTPEYAGALPGSFKNLLDWTVGGGEIYQKPVLWLNASGSPTGAVKAHESLRIVLGYVGAILVEDACAHIPVPRDAIGDDGLIADPTTRSRIVEVLAVLETHLSGGCASA